jgi:hypothetical protein
MWLILFVCIVMLVNIVYCILYMYTPYVSLCVAGYVLEPQHCFCGGFRGHCYDYLHVSGGDCCDIPVVIVPYQDGDKKGREAC